ncbi:MAG: CPBP family intramembrane metalloprotease [Sphingobacteriales bacterium]|nr:MAG: CPBP family intramembrane metalloprotease [Sphingobacteriales bacterium]
MTQILSYLREYATSIDKWLLIFSIIFIGVFIVINYRFGLETKIISNLNSRWDKFIGFYLVYATAFIIPYLFIYFFRPHQITSPSFFWILLLIAPALFALKVTVPNPFNLLPASAVNRFIAIVTNLPFKLLILLVPLFILYWLTPGQTHFWGLTTTNFKWQPYFLMLLFMLPLIAFASSQADFLATYPKLKQIAFIQPHTKNMWWYKLLYEISYGIDFISIELFFRGFLVFAFVKYAGPSAIIPMATFYCSIHFGKPLLECISSFFGGMLLGIVASNTQSIAGGLVVHLGIAWLMEAGGFLGNLIKK